jgi:hypothetical protein
VIVGKGHLPAYALKEFAFVTRGPVLLVLKSDTLFLGVACT